MSISKKHLADAVLCKRIVTMYSTEGLTKGMIAAAVGVTPSTVQSILERDVPASTLKHIKSGNYRKSKTGTDNPMQGKLPENFIGYCKDGHGYLTAVEDGKREFVHRIIFARMIGIHVSDLPSSLHVHHIDGNKTNNLPGNLALVNGAGHRALHRKPLTTAAPKPQTRRLRTRSR